MSEKLFSCLSEAHPDGLDIRLDEINSFFNSFQNIKDIIKLFHNHEAKKYKKKYKTYKIINCLLQSTDGNLVSAVSSTSILLSVTGVGKVVVPIASGIRAGVCIFSKFIGEYLERKEQHNFNKYTHAGGTLNNFQKLHTKCLEDKK